jgi:uncharacterized delta-60 repeat protein
MKVEVVEKNRAPEIIRIDVEGEVWIGGRFVASAVGYDPEGDEMSYEWVFMKGEKDYSGWMMVYAATAIVDVPENASGGTYQMKVKVKDSEGGERIFAREIKLTKEVKKGESVCVPSEEVCDGLDNDCNGLIDDGVKLVFYKDLDGDGYTDGTTSVGCSAPQGYVLSALLGDCNDENNQINPGKTEICDGMDNNCNGLIDEGVKLVFYKDLDGDGYTDGITQVGCSAPSGYVLSATSGDCNDNDPNINPGKAEICDGKDNNCNGQIDEGVLLVFYKDKDGDGYGDVNDQTLACAQPPGYVSNSSDCNDNDPNVSPEKTEICDGKDNDCDGQIDEGFNVGQSCTVGVGECARTGQFVCKADGSGTHCNATPGTPTTEICDGRDNDCDGQIDEGIVCHFAKTIGGSADDVASSIIQSSDGGYVVAGYTQSFGAGGWDFYVVKLDSSGNVIWTKTIGGGSDDVARSIIQSSDGGYVVAGWTNSFGAGGWDFYVVKLDSSGNVVWTKTIGGIGDDQAWSIIQSSDGGYVVAGNTSSFGAGGWDFYVVKLDANGNVVWTKTIGGTGSQDEAWSIIQSSDGGYVVAGWSDSFGAGLRDFYVVKLDANGNVVWSKTIGGSYGDGAHSIIQSSDGGYIVAGSTETFGAGGWEMYIVKLNSSGNVQWTKTIGGPAFFDDALSIIHSSDGGYVVAGYTNSFGAGGSDFFVVKLDSSGNVVWAKTIGGSDDEAWGDSIVQSSDGGYVVAGWTKSFGAGGRDIYVVKMDANGNVCFSQNITNYSVSSNVGSFSSPSTVAISQSPTVGTISPTVSSGGSVSDVCASSPAPHLCSGSQDCGFGSAVETNKGYVKSYGCSAGGVLSRFLILVFMLIIIYGRFRRKKKKV